MSRRLAVTVLVLSSVVGVVQTASALPDPPPGCYYVRSKLELRRRTRR
jgi:hypothetical protein